MRALLLATVIAIAAPAWAQQDAVQPVAQAVPAALVTAPDQGTPDAGKSIDEEMDSYIEAKGFAERERRGEIAILRGTEVVGKLPTDAEWVMFRSLAYDQSLLNAQADYVIKQNTRIVADATSEMYRAADQVPPAYQQADKNLAKTDELIRKLVALGTGEIDKQLRDLNINPADYERLPEPQRYEQMRSKLMLKAMEQAFGELVGLTPIQTFEKNIGNDVYKVGVVAVVSPRMKDFAQRVVTERGQFPPDATHHGKLADLVADKSMLVRDFGVRWKYDENGLPVIVSYAQWASNYKGKDPITAERFREVAFRQAEQRADAQIADFLKGSVDVKRSSEMGQTMVLAADRMPDGYIAQQDEIRKLLNAYQDSIRRQSSVSVTGLVTLAHWSTKHPETGQTIIGVVRIWSAAGEQAMRDLRDGRAPKIPAASEPVPSGPGPVRTGRPLMDATDF